jgi:hypothetical protein
MPQSPAVAVSLMNTVAKGAGAYNFLKKPFGVAWERISRRGFTFTHYGILVNLIMIALFAPHGALGTIHVRRNPRS